MILINEEIVFLIRSSLLAKKNDRGPLYLTCLLSFISE